jgi:hypothetical protein
MKLLYLTSLALLSALTADAARNPPPSSKAVLLSNIKTLTLRADKKTSHRRVSAIPQLKCIGGNAKGRYDIDVMRCTNAGSSYDGADVEWSCTASLPEEFKLGSTDVICEGYANPDDEYVLKGSCGVEYRLVLTRKGEERFGSKGKMPWSGWGEGDEGGREEKPTTNVVVTTGFWILFIGVLCWMVYSAFTQRNARQRQPRRPGQGGNPRPWGGGGGGGGGGGWDDPPPPYDSTDYTTPRGKPSTSSSRREPTGSRGWTPGFWSGAGAGAAAGYAAGAYANRGNSTRSGWGLGGRGDNGGEGSSGTRSTARSSSDFSSSNTYSSTGFGSTSRR